MLVTGVVVGFTMPLLLYSSLVVIGRGDIYSTGTWKMGWIHFRLCFYVAYQVHTHKAQARSSRLRLTDARLRQATGRRTSRYGHPITENVLALALTMMGSRAGRHKIKRRRNEVFAVQF